MGDKNDPRERQFIIIPDYEKFPDLYDVGSDMLGNLDPDILGNLDPELRKLLGLDLERLNESKKQMGTQDKIMKYVKCGRCGRCCREESPMLEPKDVRTLSKHFRLDVIRFYENYCTSHSFAPGIPYLYNPCPFLWKKGNIHRCRIYDIRPIICKYYPFNVNMLIIKCKLGEKIYEKMRNSGQFTEDELKITTHDMLGVPKINVDVRILEMILKIVQQK